MEPTNVIKHRTLVTPNNGDNYRKLYTLLVVIVEWLKRETAVLKVTDSITAVSIFI